MIKKIINISLFIFLGICIPVFGKNQDHECDLKQRYNRIYEYLVVEFYWTQNKIYECKYEGTQQDQILYHLGRLDVISKCLDICENYQDFILSNHVKVINK